MQLNQTLTVLEVAAALLFLSHANVFGETAPAEQPTGAYIAEKPVAPAQPTQPSDNSQDAKQAFVNATAGEPGGETKEPELTERRLGEQTRPDGTRVVKMEILQGGRRVSIVYQYYPPNSREPNVVQVYNANQELIMQELTLPNGTIIRIPYRNGLPVPGRTQIIRPDL